MKKITTDFHIHSECSCDSACLKFDDLVAEQKRCGITDYGITDHWHSRVQEADIAASRREYDRVMAAHPELRGHFHFGIELSVMSDWEIEKIAKENLRPVYGIRSGGPAGTAPCFDMRGETLEKYGVEFVVAGVHWDLYAPRTREALAADYMKQSLFAISSPFTDIFAHFCWAYPSKDLGNPFADFSLFTPSMLSELKSALLENRVAFELNLPGVVLSYPEDFVDRYLGFAKDLQDSGVVLSLGSDTHEAHILPERFGRAEVLFDRYGLDPEKFWKL